MGSLGVCSSGHRLHTVSNDPPAVYSSILQPWLACRASSKRHSVLTSRLAHSQARLNHRTSTPSSRPGTSVRAYQDVASPAFDDDDLDVGYSLTKPSRSTSSTATVSSRGDGQTRSHGPHTGTSARPAGASAEAPHTASLELVSSAFVWEVPPSTSQPNSLQQQQQQQRSVHSQHHRRVDEAGDESEAELQFSVSGILPAKSKASPSTMAAPPPPSLASPLQTHEQQVTQRSQPQQAAHPTPLPKATMIGRSSRETAYLNAQLGASSRQSAPPANSTWQVGQAQQKRAQLSQLSPCPLLSPSADRGGTLPSTSTLPLPQTEQHTDSGRGTRTGTHASSGSSAFEDTGLDSSRAKVNSSTRHGSNIAGLNSPPSATPPPTRLPGNHAASHRTPHQTWQSDSDGSSFSTSNSSSSGSLPGSRSPQPHIKSYRSTAAHLTQTSTQQSWVPSPRSPTTPAHNNRDQSHHTPTHASPARSDSSHQTQDPSTRTSPAQSSTRHSQPSGSEPRFSSDRSHSAPSRSDSFGAHPRRAPDPRGAFRLPPAGSVHLARMQTTAFAKAPTPAALLGLLENHVGSLNGLHVAAALNRAAKLLQAQEPTGQEHASLSQASPAETAQAGRGADGSHQQHPHSAQQGAASGGNDCSSGSSSCDEVSYAENIRRSTSSAWRSGDDASGDGSSSGSSSGSGGSSSSGGLHAADLAVRQRLLQTLDTCSLAAVEQWGARELCGAVWAWAKMDHLPDQQTWDSTLLALCGDGQASQLLRHSSTAPPPAIVNANPQALSNVAWALSRLRRGTAHQWSSIAESARPCLSVANPFDLSNLAYGFASAGRYHPVLFALIATSSLERLHDFRPQDTSNLLWAFATCGHRDPRLFTAAAGAVQALLQGFTLQGLVNTVWAYATCGLRPTGLFECVIREARSRGVRHMSTQNLSLLVWAAARARVVDAALFDEVYEATVARLPQFQHRELAPLLWAFAWSRHRAVQLMEVATPQLLLRLPDFSVLDMSNLLWAINSNEFYNVELMRAALRRCHTILPSIISAPASLYSMRQHTSHSTPRTSATSSSPPSPWHSRGCSTAAAPAAAAAASPHLNRHGASGDGDSSLDGGSSGGGGGGGTILNDATRDNGSKRSGLPRSSSSGGSSSSSSISEGISDGGDSNSSSSSSGHVDSASGVMPGSEVDVASVIAGAALHLQRTHGKGMSLQSWCGVCWGLMVLRHRDQEFWSQALEHIGDILRAPTAEPRPKDFVQLFQVTLWLQVGRGVASTRRVSGDKARRHVPHSMTTMRTDGRWSERIPAQFLAEAHQLWLLGAKEQKTVSLFQHGVNRALMAIGAEPRLEVQTADGLFSIDMVGTWQGVALAVEANGPTHYLREPTGRMLGNKVLRDAFISRRGYLVVNVSYLRWEACNDVTDEQERLVRRCVEEAVAQSGGRKQAPRSRLPVGQRR
ncbi:MAG: hypothetical protein WDW38_009359 [Sanguina aurantia]